MTNRRKNLFVFYELNENKKTYHSNLVRLYTNPLIIDEDHQIEILGTRHLASWNDFHNNISIVSDMLENSKEYINQNSDIHFIYGSSYYFQRSQVNNIKGNSLRDEYEKFMQETIQEAIAKVDLNNLCLNITLTILSGHFLKAVTKEEMQEKIIQSEIKVPRLFPEKMMDTQIYDDIHEFQQRVLLSNSYKTPEIEPDLDINVLESMIEISLRLPKSTWSYERLTSIIFQRMSEFEENLVKQERVKQQIRYDDFIRSLNLPPAFHCGMKIHEEDLFPEDLEFFHLIKCYRFTSTI